MQHVRPLVVIAAFMEARMLSEGEGSGGPSRAWGAGCCGGKMQQGHFLQRRTEGSSVGPSNSASMGRGGNLRVACNLELIHVWVPGRRRIRLLQEERSVNVGPTWNYCQWGALQATVLNLLISDSLCGPLSSRDECSHLQERTMSGSSQALASGFPLPVWSPTPSLMSTQCPSWLNYLWLLIERFPQDSRLLFVTLCNVHCLPEKSPAWPWRHWSSSFSSAKTKANSSVLKNRSKYWPRRGHLYETAGVWM
jgi:hypothetical protein